MRSAIWRGLCTLLLIMLIFSDPVLAVLAEEVSGYEEEAIETEEYGTEEHWTEENGTEEYDAEETGPVEVLPEESEAIDADEPIIEEPATEEQAIEEQAAEEGEEEGKEIEEPAEEGSAEGQITEEQLPEEITGKAARGASASEPDTDKRTLTGPDSPIRAVDFPGITMIGKQSVMDSRYASGIKWTTRSAVSFWAEEGYSYSVGNKVLTARQYESGPAGIGKIVSWAVLPETADASGHIGAWITGAGVYKGDPVDVRETFYWEPVVIAGEAYQPVIFVGFNYTSQNINNGYYGYAGYTVRFEVFRSSDHSSPIPVDTAVMIGDIDDFQQIHLHKSGHMTALQATSDSRIYMKELPDRYVGYSEDLSSIDYPEDSYRAEFDGVTDFTISYGLGASLNTGFMNPFLGLGPDDAAAVADAAAEQFAAIRNEFAVSYDGGDWNGGPYGIGYWNTRSFGGYSVPTPVKRASDTDEESTEKHSVLYNEDFGYEIAVTIPDEYADYYYEYFAMEDTLPDGIEYVSSRIIDDGDNDVTDKFSINAAGQCISAVLNSPWESGFYNNSYRWKLNVRAVAGIPEGSLYNSAKVVVSRGGELTENLSNSVETVVEKPVYRITTSAECGTIDPSFDAVYGSSAVIRFSPDEGYALADVSVDGISITMDTDANLSVDTDAGTGCYTLENITGDHSICVVYCPRPVSSVTDEEEPPQIVPEEADTYIPEEPAETAAAIVKEQEGTAIAAPVSGAHAQTGDPARMSLWGVICVTAVVLLLAAAGRFRTGRVRTGRSGKSRPGRKNRDVRE